MLPEHDAVQWFTTAVMKQLTPQVLSFITQAQIIRLLVNHQGTEITTAKTRLTHCNNSQRCLQSRSDVQCSVFVFSSIFIWGSFKAWFFLYISHFYFGVIPVQFFVNFIYCSIFIFKFWDLWNFRVHLKHLSFLRCESLHSADIAAKKPASLSIQLLSFLTSLIVPLL